MELLLALALILWPGNPLPLVFENEYILTPRVERRAKDRRLRRMVLNEDRRSSVVPLDRERNLCDDPSVLERFSSCSPNFALIAHAVPDDPLFAAQWGHGAGGIAATEAWNVTAVSPDVVVAVIDTGIDSDHPDIRPNLWRNPEEIPDNGIDDDGNGYVDDVHGIDTSAGDGDPQDDSGHGTHVAGIIGAAGNNRIGIAGTTWNVRLMPLKFLRADGIGRLSDALDAFDYVVAMRERGENIRIVNTSWGGSPYSQPFADALAALEKSGIAVVASAGNLGGNNDVDPQYPASFSMPHLVSVAALGRDGRRAAFSSYRSGGPQLAAPGVEILSTFRDGDYASLSGTSMAAPFVSGALALLFSREPELSPSEGISRLYESAIPVHGGLTVERASAARLLARELPPLEVLTVEAIASRGRRDMPGVAVAGSELRIEALGKGTGTLPMIAAFDGRPCGDSVALRVTDGAAVFRWRIPRNIRRSIRRMEVSIGSAQSSIRIKRRPRAKGLWGRKGLCTSLYLAQYR